MGDGLRLETGSGAQAMDNQNSQNARPGGPSR
jgi:hypothetical protein